jgi:hypothetical protein
MHLAVSANLLGEGEHLFGGLDLPSLGYACTERVDGARATHFVIGKR